MKRVLLIASASSRFTYEYIENILMPDYSVDIADIDNQNAMILPEILEFYQRNNIRIFDFRVRNHLKLHKINLLLSRTINIAKLNIIKKYDIVHFHYLTEEILALKIFRTKSKINLTVYGSDFLRAKKIKKKIIRSAIKECTNITVATSVLYNKILFEYKEAEQKIKLIPLGVNNIEFAKSVNNKYSVSECRKEFNIPIDKFVIFGGYNGNPAHRHIEILKELEKLDNEIKAKICLVFFCSYSLSDSYKEKLENEIKHADIECVLFTEYLSGESIMKFRKCADVMLNLQPTDALSASMIESLLVGNIVVKGSWLEYKELENADIRLESISDISELSKKIASVISDKKMYDTMLNSNTNSIYKLLSWKEHRDEWRSLL